MRSKIIIPPLNSKKVAMVLNTLLADEYLLYTKTGKAHWKVERNNFGVLHKFFENQCDALDSIIDNVAERIRALGHFALGTLKDFLMVARLDEFDGDLMDHDRIVKTLFEDHESIIYSLRKDITVVSGKYGDSGTADFMNGITKQHERMACDAQELFKLIHIKGI